MSTYVVAVVVAAVSILIAALISNSIQFEGGANPRDPKKRKIWFWVLFVCNPILFYVLAALVLVPSKTMYQEAWFDSLPIALGVGVVAYFISGFVLSKVFKNGKLGNWF